MSYFIGFDIGGSNVKAVLTKDRRIIKSKIEILPDNLNGLLGLIFKIVYDFEQMVGVKKGEIKGVGVALAGVLDKKRERVLAAPNIKYLENKPIKKLLLQKLKKYSVEIDNDVNCFLFSEAQSARTKKFNNIFYIALGTGLGGAWMFRGALYRGAHNAAGELGHTILKLKIKNEKLKILGTSDLEDLASNKIFKKLTGKSAEEIFASAKNGDKRAKAVFEIMGQNLGLGLANLINILDPEVIILGGGIAKANEFFLPAAKKTMEKYIISPLAKKTKIIATVSPLAGARGAAFLFDKNLN